MNRGTLKKKKTNKQTNKNKKQKNGKVAIRPKTIIVFIIQMTSNHYFTAFFEQFSARAT